VKWLAAIPDRLDYRNLSLSNQSLSNMQEKIIKIIKTNHDELASAPQLKERKGAT
jgi:hypothetical protein